MLKPIDIVVLLKILTSNKGWTYGSVAEDLTISQSKIRAALARCEESGLYVDRAKRVLNSALKEFLIHGLKYSFPVKPGALVVGIPTAHSASPLSKLLLTNNAVNYVWSCDRGTVEGNAIEPLHHCILEAVQKDSHLYILLALTDSLRVGKAREREVAIRELEIELQALI